MNGKVLRVGQDIEAVQRIVRGLVRRNNELQHDRAEELH